MREQTREQASLEIIKSGYRTKIPMRYSKGRLKGYEILFTRSTRSEITKLEIKISEPDPKYINTRTGSIPLYQNTQKFKIPDLNPNGYPNADPYFLLFSSLVSCLGFYN